MTAKKNKYLSVVYAICKKCGERHELSSVFWRTAKRKAARCPSCGEHALRRVSLAEWRQKATREARQADLSRLRMIMEEEI